MGGKTGNSVSHIACSKPKSTPVNPFTIASLLLLCLALVVYLAQRRNTWRNANEPWPFYAKRPLISPEQVLHQRLVTALPGYIVLARVPVSAVLGIKRGHNAQTWTRRIRHLQYDFVVFSKDATELVVIELEDGVRSEKEYASIDQIKARASTEAGVRLLRWQARALPEHAEIQAVFGVPLTQVFEDVASSANQSWWPPISSAGRSSQEN
jgi:hypothetical protein